MKDSKPKMKQTAVFCLQVSCTEPYTLTGLNIGHQRSRWISRHFLSHHGQQPQSSSTLSPGPTQHMQAQQPLLSRQGGKAKSTVLTTPHRSFPLMFSLCLSNIRRIISTFLWNPDRMGDMLFA